MRGRRPGRPTMWVNASIEEWVQISRAGIEFPVWRKWGKSKRTKLGTLIVSVGGIRWRPASGKYSRWYDWNWIEENLT